MMPSLERPAFFDGQRLGGADLEAIYAYHAQLRRLHNRALHNWGIALGFTVAGAKGGREVSVSPGYAIDCEGHDLVLGTPRTLAVPAAGGATTYYLTASYADDPDLEPAERREGVCEGSGAVRRIEAPRLRWQRPTDLGVASRYRRGLDLILATVTVEGCSLAAAPSTADRRSARPESQPYVAGGATDEGGTAWSYFPGAPPYTGVQTVVDTGAAGFGRTPTYVAQVVGSRLLQANARLIDGFVGVASPTPTGFTLQVTLPRNLSAPPYTLNPSAAFTAALPETLRTGLRWYVTWLGVEG